MASRPLGSFIPDSVTADVLSFLPKSNVLDFNLISPRAHYIVCEHKVISRDYESVGVSQKGNNIKYYCVSKEDAEKGTFAWRKFDEIGENITKDRLFSFLSVCRSIDSLLWQIDVDDIIIKALKTINIENISIGECKLYANPEIFEAFLKEFEKPIDLTHVEMDNKLITYDILRKMSNVDIFCSRNRDRQSIEHRRCELDDDHLYFLDENSQSRNRFKLTGFLTNFTVDTIEEIIKGLYKWMDLGILYQEEMDDAIALAKKKECVTSLKLYSWNGLAAIRFRFHLWDIGDDDKEMGNFEPMYFDVSLTESSDGKVEMVHPDAVMSRKTFLAFEKVHNILRKMSNVDIFCSRNRDRQSIEHRRCELDDDHLYFLDENSQSRNRFKLTGFLTNFTVDTIEEIIKGLYKWMDLGILYQEEMDDAIALAKKKECLTSLKLYSWNGLAAIRFRAKHGRSVIMFSVPEINMEVPKGKKRSSGITTNIPTKNVKF